MTEHRVSAHRSFGFDAQRQFAVLSGDHNPLHLDAVVARRTQAGAPVVHGINLLLWALDTLAAALADLPAPRKIRVRFSKFVYVGETAEVQLTEQNSRVAKLQVAVSGTPAAQIVIEFGAAKSAIEMVDDDLQAIKLPTTPLAIEFDVMANCAGRLPFATPPEQLAAMFPAAAQWLSARRLAALAACTNLVGMVCPGLHSIFSSLSIETCAEFNPQDTLNFRVTSTDPRFRLVRMSIAGGGVVGTIDSFARVPPTAQASMASLAGVVSPSEFAGSTALIVGGSRGIGELTAKLIASGGGRTIITYQSGKADAEKVAHEINSSGGNCELMRYDARQPAAQQLVSLTAAPTHLYYFATPAIFGRQSDNFARHRLDDFLAIYVDGFWQLVQALRERRAELAVFYPSSVAVDGRPRGMTEYAMAKAAGELLCADMNDTLAPVHISVQRLPRMETDQTATFIPVDSCSALDTMLPLVREVQSWPKTPI